LSWASKVGWGVLVTGGVTIVAAMIPLGGSIVANFYSAVQQCNQDASALETQLTSIMLEISGREERMKSLLSARANSLQQPSGNNNESNDALINELGLIEIGADSHFEDPLFKEHSLVQLVTQYNRLLRRVEFPQCDADSKAPWCPAELSIDTRTTHPNIETGQFIGQLDSVSKQIDNDLAQLDRQQGWHKQLGPVHLCSTWTLWTKEPWKLIGLQQRLKSQ
jgi:hypothetical protein